MMRRRLQLGHDPLIVTRTSNAIWRKPLAGGKNAWKSGDSVFVCSWSDFFHRDAEQWRLQAWDVMSRRPWIHWIICTKRAGLISSPVTCVGIDEILPNLWLGVTVECDAAHLRLQLLLDEWRGFGRGLFVSIEPMLDLPNIIDVELEQLSAVIVGGETGPNARPIQADWVRSIRDQCGEAGVPFFLKQLGDNAWDGNTKLTGRLLDGREHNDLPWRANNA